jgi:hypothetical protein
LEEGRIDLPRARVLSDATSVCTDTVARQVEATMLALAGDGRTEVLSPRNWRARTERAVIKADPGAARARREQAKADRQVRTWPDRDGNGILRMRAAIEDIILAESVIGDLAHAAPAHDQHGHRLTMDERRVAAVMDMFRRVREGTGLPDHSDPADQAGQEGQAAGANMAGLAGQSRPVVRRREREVGIVLHADCFAPVLMEALIPRKDEGYGSTEEVPGGASGAGDSDGVGCSGGSGYSPVGVYSDR